MNPYSFVPLGEPPRRTRPPGHDHFSGHSGQLDCALTMRTPLFIYGTNTAAPAEANGAPGHDVVDFPTLPDGRPVIWGTAIRGVLRSVAEAASASCLTLFDGHYERWAVDYRDRLPPAFRRCDNPEHLCPSCRLFGTVGAARSGHAGLVRVGDAALRDGSPGLSDRITLAPLQSPKPHHAAFYLSAEGSIAGRKFYHHRPQGPIVSIERSRYTRTVQPLAPGATLDFRLHYHNLSDDDLRLLLFALVLEPGLGHKLGMGKPIGMGSVTLAIVAAQTLEPRDVALHGPATSLAGDELQEWINAILFPLRGDTSANLEALRQLLALDPRRPVAYPSPQWFREHPEARLDEVPDFIPSPAIPPRRPTPIGPAMPEEERPARRVPVERERSWREGGPRQRPERAVAGPPGRRPRRRDEEEEEYPERAGWEATRPAAPTGRPARTPAAQAGDEEAVAAEEPEAPRQPATLEDLVRRFGRQAEPQRGPSGPTREGQRAREEQRRLMDRLRGKQE